MIANIRLQSQQLVNPKFDNPTELVSWMGAIQAQEASMCKWAVALRLKNGTLKSVEEALRKGEIIRTHIMRPTWHLVAAEDLRWMIALTSKRVIAANDSYGKQLGSGDVCIKYTPVLEKVLRDNNHLTRQEINEEFTRKGIDIELQNVNRLLMYGEAMGLVCSGIEKGGKHTFALLDERVAPTPELTKEEALAKLAEKYFQSHSPATIEDFVWWSGLTLTESRKAIALIKDRLWEEKINDRTFYIHELYRNVIPHSESLHLLPSYDEYLISYKNRCDVLKPEHKAKAHNNYGIFYPVVLHNGKVVGNWKKSKKKGMLTEQTFWERELSINAKVLSDALERYKLSI